MFSNAWWREKRALGLAVVLCLAGTAYASGAPAAAPAATGNYTTRVWQTRDGLPQETVQAIAQTPDGFLWIGTTGGLLRFDGSRFVSYDRSNVPAFTENSVFSLLTGSDGSLWIGTEGGGLICMQGGTFRHFGVAEGVADGFVRSVLEDRRGQIWIGTDDGLFLLRDHSAARATRVDNTPSIPAIAVHALAEGRDGTIWAGGSRLLAIRNGAATSYPLVGQYSETRVKSILQTHDGTVWVGTVSGLQRLVANAGHFERYADIQATVRTLRETTDGTLWIGTIGRGAYTLRRGQLTALASGEIDDLKLPSNTMLSLFEDAESNIWMGTQAGLLRFSRSPVRLVPLPHASDSDFETISRDNDDSLWVSGTTLSHLVHGIAMPMSFPALHGARVRNVFRAKDGSLWIGTDGRGLFHLGPGAGPGAPAEQFTVVNGLVNNFVRGILQATNGDLWIATDEGVTQISGGVLRNFTVQDGLVYFSVRALLEDRNGDLWIGTDRGLSHLVKNHFVEDAATRRLAGAKVWSLDQTPNGALWIGTRDDGLYRVASPGAAPKHFTIDQGLASNSVFQILDDTHGRFWMSGENGVSVIAIADLDRLATDPHFDLSKRFFAVSAGGELSPLYGGTMPAGALTSDGDVWFPTSKGPVRFLAAGDDPHAVPRVFLDPVVADGRTFPVTTGRVDLSASSRNLEIAYGSILLGPQDAVQFQYKLENFDRDWRYGSNRRVADYTNLPAGQYTFRIRAFEGSGDRRAERTLQIVKHQYFFLTGWFLSGGAVLLALVIWWMHRLKLRRVELAFQAVLEERARLAREMHDTLIQGCAGVSLLLEAASANDLSAGSDRVELLDYARIQLAAAMDEARQAVWNLRGQESLDFAETLQRMAERLDRSSTIDIACTVEGEAYDFNATAIHEITMASREAIFNAILHANPANISVRATFGADVFTLTVVDDGSGFETSPDPNEGHFGLKGIQERIKRLGGSVDLVSAIDRGTRISIRVPRAAVCAPAPTAHAGNALQEAIR